MNVKRLLKKFKKRESNKLATHLEKYGAAWCQENNLSPSDAVLVSKRLENGETEYRFEKKVGKVNMDELHDDIRIVFDFVTRLDAAWDAAVEGGIKNEIQQFMAKYKDPDEKLGNSAE